MWSLRRTPHIAGDPYSTHVNIGRQQDIGLWATFLNRIDMSKAPMAYSWK